MVTVEEMIAVVQQYIYQRKGVRVHILINPHPFLFQEELNKLNYAYSIALEWLKK